MRYFRSELWNVNSSFLGRRWIFVPYDQLTDEVGPLAQNDPRSLGIVLIESSCKPKRRAYHKQKLALVLSNQRHFALEQARRGVAVHYISTQDDYATALRKAHDMVGTMLMMEPAERALRSELAPLIDDGLLVLRPNALWLSDTHDFVQSMGDRPWRMDRFYKHMRRRYQLLLDEEGRPEGGSWSLDHANRKPWRGSPPAPRAYTFITDRITDEVCQFVETTFADHPGSISRSALPSMKADAEHLWAWSKRRCMQHFGPYEDAMSSSEPTLFHTTISALLNLGRLRPKQVIEDVLELDIPLNSKEGFVRQVLGWREFVRHVHAQTDGLRQLPPRYGGITAVGDQPAQPNVLQATQGLPPVYWGEQSGLACLDQVVSEVMDTGYTHHINRLMILANWGTLLNVNPRELTDWFWTSFTDAYDWVVEPNVLGMGTFATGDLMSTKPYVSGSAYVDRMSDYCSNCAFKPGVDCPMTPMYWNFLNSNQDNLGSNPRMRLALVNAERRSEMAQALDAHITEMVITTLAQGERLVPELTVESKVSHG